MTPKETWVALVHHPVYDRNRQVVATALTNLDLHDIARSARTYDLAGFFIVHPVEAMRQLAAKISGHWQKEGAEINDFRRMAIDRVEVVATLDDASQSIFQKTGQLPHRVVTSARPSETASPCRKLVAELSGPALVILGTGWGLTDELVASCPYRLAPIMGDSDYNHLSVRSACAIILDRLYGDREE